MTSYTFRRYVPFILLAVATAAPADMTPMATVDERQLLGDFEKGWDRAWYKRRLAEKRTLYEAVTEGTNRVLRATSDMSNSALGCRLDVEHPSVCELTWRWKVEEGLTGNNRERQTEGDDYAARVMVVFETYLSSWKNRVISYVWAAEEPEGTVFPGAYSKNIATFVLRSGAKHTGKWNMESRDVLADYQTFFGEPPTEISGVVLVVDSDNTGLRATSYFDDLNIRLASTQDAEM